MYPFVSYINASCDPQNRFYGLLLSHNLWFEKQKSILEHLQWFWVGSVTLNIVLSFATGLKLSGDRQVGRVCIGATVPLRSRTLRICGQHRTDLDLLNIQNLCLRCGCGSEEDFPLGLDAVWGWVSGYQHWVPEDWKTDVPVPWGSCLLQLMRAPSPQAQPWTGEWRSPAPSSP